MALQSAENDILALNREGTTVQSVKYETLKEFELRVPPPQEQCRIVARVEELIGKIRSGQERLDKIPGILERFRLSVLGAAADGRLTADWRTQRKGGPADEFLRGIRKARLSLCDSAAERAKIEAAFAGVVEQTEAGWLRLPAWLVCDFITKGTTPPTDGITPTGDVPYLKVYNIVDNKIDFVAKPQFVKRKIHEGFLNRSRVYPGDVLMNIVGPPLGKIAIVPKDFPEWNINQALAIFRPVKPVSPQFLWLALQGGESLRGIIAETRGIVGQNNISLEQCRGLEVLLPPPEAQAEVVRRANALLSLADRLEARHLKAIAHVDKLTQSILAKAFRGELVPTEAELARREGRSYETAEQLLDRIRREPSTSGTNGRPKRALAARKT